MATDLLDRLDRYLDLAPRSDADAQAVGPFTLFVGKGEWSYYARPRRGLEGPISTADIAALASRCAECKVDLAIEWIDEVTPSLDRSAREAGLEVERHQLMALEPSELHPVDPPAGIAIEVLRDSDRRLADGRAVAETAFRQGGTDVGDPGASERDREALSLSPALREHLARRSIAGLTITAVATGEDGVLASGSLQPAGGVGEVVGVATLPRYRRQGLAAAVTSALVREGSARGLSRIVLSAQSAAVAHIYEGIGFRHCGASLAARG